VSGILCVHNASGIEQADQGYLAALRRLTHRGPDGEGSCLRPALFIGVRRSSAGRASTSDQPLASDDGSVIVALDGQIHNRADLSECLRTNGYVADLSSDAALVLGAYRMYGEQCFERLCGVWAVVLWDERTHRLLAGRDPLGVRPLYYYMGARNLIVASRLFVTFGESHTFFGVSNAPYVMRNTSNGEPDRVKTFSPHSTMLGNQGHRQV
jgi:asparagine synthase (glutamine-hydrolysing)